MSPVTCPDCHRDVLAEDMDLGSLVARCRSCRISFRFPLSASFIPRERFKLPRKYTAEASEDRAQVRIRWWSNEMYPMALFACVWSGFIIQWYTGILADVPEKRPPFLIVPLMPAVLGAILGYVVLAYALNRTRILIDSRRLEVQVGPIPWWGSHSLRRDEAEQIFCDDPFSRHSTMNVGVRTACCVRAALKDGSRVTLLRGVSHASDALALEQWIEDKMGIPDTPIRGELPRD